MKLSPLFLSVLVMAGCGDAGEYADMPAAESSEVTADSDAQQTGDWIVLFDGTSLDNFRGFGRDDVPASWSIGDGALGLTPGTSDGGDIMTRGQFGDFELVLEWRISEAGNSGIIYRVSEEFRSPWMTGPEYQVLDNDKHPDAQYGDDRKAGANYDMHDADPDAVRPVGEWNEARIVARGEHVEHWLNGQMIVEYELNSEDWTARMEASKWIDHPEYGQRMSGHIALQDHGDPVWYRNIRIREL